MKTFKLFFIYILILFGLVACSVTTYSVITDYDQEAKFDDYQTFYWSDNFQANNPDVEDPLFYNSLIKKRIKNAVQHELVTRGYRIDSVNPDLLVNSHVVVQQNASSWSNFNYPYYSFYGWYPINNGSYFTKEMNSGGVVIELIDRNRHQLVWQGFAPGVLTTSTKDKQKDIQEAVAKIFSSYKYGASIIDHDPMNERDNL